MQRSQRRSCCWENFFIFHGNVAKGCQQFSLNPCNVSKTPPFWLKNKMVVVSQPPLSQTDHTPCDFRLFPGMGQDLKGRRSAEESEVQRDSLAALGNISVEDFRQCFQQRQRRWNHCIQSQEYFEGD
jgi:hypothetical protein